jgi:hypothetical protein
LINNTSISFLYTTARTDDDGECLLLSLIVDIVAGIEIVEILGR